MRDRLKSSRFTRPALVVLCALGLWLVPGKAVPPASAAGPYLYITNYGSNHLVKSTLDGSSSLDMGTLGGTLSQPTGIALDTKHQKMYIVNSAGSVVVANLDGLSAAPVSFNPAVTVDNVYGVAGIALDIVRGKMYIANYGKDNIIKANLDGSEAMTLDLGGNIKHPYGIALDTRYEWMYVTSAGDGKVIRASLDGTDASVLTFSPSVTLSSPRGIAIDFASRRLYITNALSPYHLIRASMDGTHATDLGNPENLVNFGLGITVDHLNQKLYLVSDGNRKIVQTDLNGGNAVELADLTPALSGPVFIALDTPPDVRAGFTNNAAGGIPVGSGFNWNVTISNFGPNPAVFDNGQVIFRDALPVGPSYTVGTPTNYEATYTGTLSCTIASNILTCLVSGGSLSLAAGYSWLALTVYARPHDVGILSNPSGGGVCQADPGNVTGDTDLSNNTCSDTVTVNPASILRGHQMYLGNVNETISRANLDGSGGTNLGNPGALVRSLILGMALDTMHAKLYIVSSGTTSVIRANLDGTGGEDLGNLGGLLTNPAGIALDVANHRMYVVNATGGIVTADLNGAGAAPFADLPASVSPRRGMALDPVHSWIYVTGVTTDNIYRLNLDGSGGTDLGNLSGKLDLPLGIAVDALNDKLYVTSSANHKVLVVNLDGSGVTDLGNLGGLCPGPRAVALDVGGGQLYVSCFSTSNPVVRAGLNGSNPTGLGDLNGTADIPLAIALDLRATLNLPLVIR